MTGPMPDALIAIRWSRAEDAAALAELHGAAWRHAYAGIIPGVTLERMISARGPAWWRRLHGAGARALLVEFDGAPAGYATLGRSRAGARAERMGEIYELYLRPTHQGIGLGRRLFLEARARLAEHGLHGLHVWALAENTVGRRFYAAMGGTEWSHARDRLGGRDLEKVGYRWG